MISVQQLTTCDQEPIHLLSKIQQSGVMFVVTYDDFLIVQVSDNCSHLLQKEPSEILETSFDTYFSKTTLEKITNISHPKNISTEAQMFFDDFKGKRLCFAIHIEEHYIIIEVSDVTLSHGSENQKPKESLIKKSIAHYENVLSFQELIDSIGQSVKDISGFDRVLIYKFDNDNNGTVLSEVSENFDESLMGHRFPASDIPIQARTLYIKNRFRQIEDASEKNALLIPTINRCTNTPVDMSMCYLRSVSPVHIEYLKNMGVMASMSISIVIGGKLWGLIACHHKTSKRISLPNFDIYYLLSSIFSYQIQEKEILEQYKLTSTLQLQRELFINGLNQYSENSFEEALNFEMEHLSHIIVCDEVIIIDGEDIIAKKSSLHNNEILKVHSIVKENNKENLFVSSNLGILYPEVLNFSEKLGGILAVRFPTNKNMSIVFLKYEQISSVLWAGNPNKQVEFKDGVMVINPRASFESWKEVVTGSSSLFLNEEISSIKILTKELELSIKLFQKYEETKKIKEEKLAQEMIMLQQSKMASMGEMIGNIIHQWRQPLSLISTYATGIMVKKEHGLLNDEVLHESCEKINKSTQRLSDIITIFRNYLMETKEVKDVVLQDTLHQSLEIANITLLDNAIELKQNIQVQEPIIMRMSAGELSEVVINIITNAKDILLENKVENPWVAVEFLKVENNIVITIEDNGGGVPIEVMPKIFEQHFTTKDKAHGTGIGLYMSYQIVTESLKGKIYVQNTTNGAKFFIEIPIN